MVREIELFESTGHKIIVNTNKERDCVLLIFMFKGQICYNEINKFVTAHKTVQSTSQLVCGDGVLFVGFSNIHIERQKFYNFRVTDLSFQQ